MDLSTASRPVGWNISAVWVMYALFVVAMAVFAYGFYQRVSLWRAGKSDKERLSDWGTRFWILVKELVFQNRVRNSSFPGFFHSLIFYSFAVLVITTAVVALDFDLHTNFFKGWVYVALTVGSELGGALILVGIAIAAVRRYVTKPKTISTEIADTWALLLIAAIIVTGFFAEGIRIATIGDQWAFLTPIGWGLSFLFTGLSTEGKEIAHRVAWWGHTVLAMGWIASIPYTKFFHLIALPMNAFFSKLKPRGELSRVDVEAMMCAEDFDETAFSLGAAVAKDFTWKQRLDFDACISCGRCEEVCPAFQSGQPFSPKQFIHGARALIADSAAKKKNGHANGNGAGAAEDAAASEGAEAEGPPMLVGGKLDEEFVWLCRTCTACMEVCPASIDHVDTLMEVRRNELMIQGRVPTEAARALKMLEASGNPFGPRGARAEWIAEQKVPVIPAGGDVDVLFWIGCCTTYDPMKQKIAQDLFKLLEISGISYGVLGDDETCCGDPARLIGDERLFQEIAKNQVAAINSRTFRVLLASCPHCYNVLKHEYKQFGGDYRVAHHSEFLHEMLWNGAIQPKSGEKRKIVYHDPCYLGRYQKIYDSPREVLRTIPGATVAEMGSFKERSWCCGGGGGHYWMDIKSKGERINNLRVDQATAAGADVICTSCPYCQQMLFDSVKLRDLDDKMKVIDIATLVLESLEGKDGKTTKSA